MPKQQEVSNCKQLKDENPQFIHWNQQVTLAFEPAGKVNLEETALYQLHKEQEEFQLEIWKSSKLMLGEIRTNRLKLALKMRDTEPKGLKVRVAPDIDRLVTSAVQLSMEQACSQYRPRAIAYIPDPVTLFRLFLQGMLKVQPAAVQINPGEARWVICLRSE